MTKKCVLWAKAGLAFGMSAATVMSLQVVTSTAQSSDPSTLPLLSADSLSYLGGFRLPAESTNGDNFEYGGEAMAFSPATNSLFVSSKAKRVAEVSIPSTVNSADATALPFATFLQPFADPTEGHLGEVDAGGVNLGLMVYGNRLYGTASIYYDANNIQRVSHYSRSLQLNQPSFSGWSRVWEPGRTGFVSGPMALIPAEWQARLGGAAVTGQCCIPVVMRTSWGPAALAFDPSQVGQTTVSATPLLYYTGEHPTLGTWSGSNSTYGAATEIGGMAVIAGTRTALYVGRNGLGPYCYGSGTADPALRGTIDADGAPLCYDPTSAYKGTHAYPYRYQLWAYDLNDFAAVKEGRKQPWEVVPYGVWPLALPTPEPTVRLGGVGYDAQRQLLYVSQLGADKDVYSYRPVIHAFRINATAAAPLPAGTTVRDVLIAADKLAPQAPKTAITFTATPSGGGAPHQYKWWTHDGTAWTMAAEWSPSPRFTWAPSAANPSYRITAWVRSAGNSADAMEASATMAFPVGAAGPATAVTLTPNRVAPQAPFTAITWTAVPTGGIAPLQYKWLVHDGNASTTVAQWSELNTFTWTPATANTNYRVSVWVRSAGNTVDAQETSASSAFPIANGTGANPSVALSAVTLSANKVAPQSIGASITWTATPAGGTAPFLYKWWTSDGTTWTPTGGWTSATSFAWTPLAANANYRIRVWVKQASNSADQAEAAADQGFIITGAAPIGTPPPPNPTAPDPSGRGVSHVTLTPNRAAPLAVGSTVIWTAQAFNGAGPYQYKWWINNGAQWTAVGGWSTGNTFAWTPTQASSNYHVGVWARSAGSTNEGEALATKPFVIK